MKVTRFLLSAVLLLAVTGNAHAQLDRLGGTVSLSWDNCSPIVVNKNMLAGPNKAYASVTGHALGHQAYQVWLLLGHSSQSLPNAWRFDATAGDPGCNAGFSGSDAVPYSGNVVALAKTCPGFVPTSVASNKIQTYQFAPAPLGFATTLGNALAAFAYPNNGAGSPNINPALRYLLVEFQCDHTFSVAGPADPAVACGGFEEGMCIYVIDGRTSWLDLTSTEHKFNDGMSNRFLTYNGGALNGLCPDVIPAAPTTWGSIKAQYKH